MSVQIAALILLVARFVTIGLTIAVLAKQRKLFSMTIDSELVHFRLVMFMLTLVFLVGSFVPVAVDVFYGFIKVDASWNLILVAYAASNAFSFLAASALIWKIYEIVARSLQEEQRIEDGRK